MPSTSDPFGHDGSRTRRHASVLAALAALLGGFACDAPGGGEPAGDEAPFLSVQAEMRIDGHAEVLVPIGWLGVAGDGSVAVLQSQDAALRLFDRDGKPLRTVGGPGQGPGEFGRPVRGGWVGDSLWVSDPALGRISVFSPDFEFVRSVPFPAVAEPRPADADRLPRFPFLFPYAVYPGDTLLLSGQWGAGDPLGERMEGLPVLLRVARDGTIDRVVREIPRNEGSLNVPFEGGVVGAPVPFFPRPLWAVSPDGERVVTLTTHPAGVEGGTLHLRVFDASGRELGDRRVPFDPVPIPRQVADSAIRAAAERAPDPSVARTIESEARDRMPPVYPPASALLVGADHRIWIGLRATEEGAPWLALGPEGEPVGRLLLSTSQSIQAADAEHVWVVERDELGVGSVVRLRVSS